MTGGRTAKELLALFHLAASTPNLTFGLDPAEAEYLAGLVAKDLEAHAVIDALNERRARLEREAQEVLEDDPLYRGPDSVTLFVGWPAIDPGAVPPKRIDLPLDPKPPLTWEQKENRVEWCLANLTPGEKALLYRLLYSEGLRIDACKDIERKEHK